MNLFCSNLCGGCFYVEVFTYRGTESDPRSSLGGTAEAGVSQHFATSDCSKIYDDTFKTNKTNDHKKKYFQTLYITFSTSKNT